MGLGSSMFGKNNLSNQTTNLPMALPSNQSTGLGVFGGSSLLGGQNIQQQNTNTGIFGTGLGQGLGQGLGLGGMQHNNMMSNTGMLGGGLLSTSTGLGLGNKSNTGGI